MKSTMKYGTMAAVAIASGLACQERAWSQTGPASAGPQNTQAVTELDPVVVLGTNRARQTALNSLAPVDVFTGAQLQASGYQDLGEALRAVQPGITYWGGAGTAFAGVSSTRPIALRGLPPSDTLVLVNGKRRHASAFVNNKGGFGAGSQAVDINAIPVSAIARVEVLRDSASAQYGSDAIAGVINIVLKEADRGGGAELQLGQFTKGDGFSRVLSGWKGLSLPRDGFLTLSADLTKNNETNNARGTDTRLYTVAGTPAAEAAADRSWEFGLQQREDINAALNGEIGIGQGWSLYSFATLTRKDDEGAHAFRVPRADGVVRAIYPNGYLPRLRTRVEDGAITLGARAKDVAGGQLDISATHGQDRLRFNLSNAVNPSLGTASPTRFDNGELINTQTALALDYTRSIPLEGTKGPLSLAAGTAYREESYEIKAGDDASWINGGVPILDGPNAGRTAPVGSQSFPGFRPADAGKTKRRTWGVYANAENQLTEQWQWGAALRGEHYSDFGWTSTGKVSGRFDATPQVALRGTLGTGFRAPTVGQLGFTSSSSNPVNNVLTEIRTLPVSSPVAQALGATSLKPEKSENVSLGLVLRPTHRSSITVDAYQIRLRDRITYTENLTGAAVTNLLTAAGFTGVGGASFFTNALDTRTRGIDLVGRHQWDLSGGARLDLSAALNYSQTKVLKVKASGIPGVTLIGRQALGNVEHAAPDTTLILTGRYTTGAWATQLSATRYGHYTETHTSNPALDQEFSAQWVADGSVTYRFSPTLALTLGGQNLFDSHPDEYRGGYTSLTGGKTSWSQLSPAGGDGAFYYARLSLSF